MTSALPAPDSLELRSIRERLVSSPDGLPEIPGGWAEMETTIQGHCFRFVLPAAPDALLNDADVHTAFDRDEYMPYWAYLWPSSLKMATSILVNEWPADSEVLELGAGIGLVGLAGLARGLRVTFSDYEPKAVELAVFNAHRAGYKKASGCVLDWRIPPEKQYPFLWGCDLLYEDRNHEVLLTLTQKTLATGGTAWFADPGRTKANRFCSLLASYGFSGELLDEQMLPLSAPRVGHYQLIQVRHLLSK